MLICLSMKSDWKSSLTWGLKMWVSVMMEQSWSTVSVNRPFVVKSLVPFGQLFMIALSFLASRMMVLLPICWMKSSVSMVFCTKWLHLCSWCGIPKKRVPKQEFLMFVWRRLVFGQMKVLPLCVFSVWQCSKSVFVSSVPEFGLKIRLCRWDCRSWMGLGDARKVVFDLLQPSGCGWLWRFCVLLLWSTRLLICRLKTLRSVGVWDLLS